MQVKKFEAETFEKALELVKAEMGPNALILSTGQKKGKWYQPSTVEVTAALERKKPEPAAPVQPEPVKAKYDEEALRQVFAHRRETEAPAAKRTVLNRYIEISDAKPDEESPIVRETVRPVQQTRSYVSGPASGYEKDFLNAGFSTESAKELARSLTLDFATNELRTPSLVNKTKARLVASRIQVLSPDVFAAKNSWVAVGAPGSGKTSFLVKLALFLKKKNRGVDLVSHDERKIIGRAELAEYARLLQLPFKEQSEHVPDPTNVTLADSPAFCWRSPAECDEIAAQCANHQVILVIDATSRLKETERTIEAARKFMPAAIAFSRVDLVTDFGMLYDILKFAKLPLLGASVSRSFKTPVKFFDALEFAHFIISSSTIKAPNN